MSSPSVPRRRVGRQLREMRQEAGLTLEQAAAKLETSTSSLNRVEQGQTLATVHLARSMMDVYEQYQPDLLDAVRRVREPGWWQSYQVGNQEYLAWEASAIVVRELAVVRLPDLLHTEDYARALLDYDDSVGLSGVQRRRAQQRLDDEVCVRHIRQRRLTDHRAPLRFTTVVDEAALRKQVGGPALMRDQLEYMVHCAGAETVTVRVLPARAGAQIGFGGGFSLLEFEDPQDPPMLYAEYPGGVIREEKRHPVSQGQQAFDVVNSAALSPEDSLSFIECLAQEVYRV